ncbi:uncharacterized protein si:ch73-70k4.1 [Thalassophryne amazonica]|uniref:uncharacterized protein si:ch73-70k4.1 n=1 Tax=Thalassophryne amazonica TaxID=390379 RepID=UPI001472019B|nr:uncharacterized protein si:ch73-70k4.1 [Thalassophryne amazonica]
MSESYPKSKLKRKKSSVEGLPQNSSCSGTSKESCTDTTEQSDGSLVLAADWWNREPLPAVESLWALTVKSALPYLDSQSWDPVPDLPEPPPSEPAVQTLNEEWFDLSNEVPPFPEFAVPFSPSPGPTPCTGPLGLNFCHQEIPVQKKSVSVNLEREVSSHSGQMSDFNNQPLQVPVKNCPQSLSSWVEEASMLEPSRGREEEKGEKEGSRQTTLVHRPHLHNQRKASDNPVLLEEERDIEGLEKVHSNGSPEEGGLQRCPMCLLVFPVGFSQMECDGHLAQCLSEMNVDMTW